MPTQSAAPQNFQLRSHPHLYEINTWTWLEQLSARLKKNITLAEVPDFEWDALAAQGFNIIWLMGVWQRSPISRRMNVENPANVAQFSLALPGWKPSDVISSAYSVTAYAPDQRIGNWAALDAAREKLRARGIALYLDFVGNHTALDHPWMREHPEYYVQAPPEEFQKNPSLYYTQSTKHGPQYIALAKDPYFPPWQDVAQLNHFNPGLRAAQLADLRTIAAHCDGIRCDMAMLQLSDIFNANWRHLLGDAPQPEKEFWTEAHAAVPSLTLLAEAYWDTEQRLLDLGFSYSYDKTLYDALRDHNIPQIRERLTNFPDRQSDFARFMENHDEQRRAVVFPNDRLAADATLLGTLPGMRFYHQGELEGRRIHLPITLRIAADEPPDPISKNFFQKILQITRQDVFHEGKWSLLDVAPEGDAPTDALLVYEWRSAKAWKIIAVNLAAYTSQGRVHLAGRVSPAQNYIFNDELNNVRYDRTGQELHNIGLFIRRDPFQAHLFDITPAP
jgi:Alpha amylase, catalytic domain